MRPPRLAVAVLRRILVRDVRNDVLADLAFHFEKRAASSHRRAWVWYWKQVGVAFVGRLREPRLYGAPDSTGTTGVGFGGLHAFWQELRWSCRNLRTNVGVTVAIVGTLALGIGATTAIYTVLHAVVLKPLPYPNAEELVFLWSHTPAGRDHLSGPDFHDILDGTDVFAELVQFKGVVDDVMDGDDGAVSVTRHSVTGNIFRTYGGKPIRGRDFRQEDRMILPPSVIQNTSAVWSTRPVVVAHHFWRDRLGGDENVVGRVLRIGGRSWEVIGVMEPGFHPLLPPSRQSPPVDMWYLSPWDERLFPRNIRFVATAGRIAPGHDLTDVQRQLDLVAQRVKSTNSEMGELRYEVTPLRTEVVSDVSRTLLVLFLAVVLVLLIACTNVAILSLVRGAARRSEYAIRTALGATRLRIACQSLLESAVLAALGGVFGLVLGNGGKALLLRLAPSDIPRLGNTTLNGGVLLFAIVVTALTAVSAGLAPALRAARVAPSGALDDRGTTGGTTRKGRLWRGSLVVAQLGVSLMLVVATSLLLQSFIRVNRVDLGFDPAGVLAAYVPVPSGIRPGVDNRIGFARELTQRLEAVPGISAASVGEHIPLAGLAWLDMDPAGPVPPFAAGFRVIAPGFLETLDLRLVEGRDMTWDDLSRTDRLVTLVNERFVRQAWPDEPSPIGQVIQLDVLRLGDGSDVWTGLDQAEVIGVVEDGRTASPHVVDPPTAFVSLRVNGLMHYVMVETDGDPRSYRAAVATTLGEVDRSVPVADAWALAESLRSATRPLQFSLTLLGAFALIALALATVGLYSVMAHAVSQRRTEFGLRMALGATAHDVARIVMRAGVMLITVGVAAGMVGAFGLAGLIENQLFGVRASDPVTYLIVVGIFFVVAGAATVVPAMRAWRSNPMEILRK